MAPNRSGGSAHALTKLVQTRLRASTAKKLTAKAFRLGYKEAAYVRRLIELDLCEIERDET